MATPTMSSMDRKTLTMSAQHAHQAQHASSLNHNAAQSQAAPQASRIRGGGASENIHVVVRSRPLSAEERARGAQETVTCDAGRGEVKVNVAANRDKTFTYDRVYSSRATQRDIYTETIEPIVMQTLAGYNTTVFAYGQTGTGKTHTMEGDLDDPENMGMIPRAVNTIFRTLGSRGGDSSDNYVKASYLEIHNENLLDLLAPVNPKEPVLLTQTMNVVTDDRVLRIVEDKRRPGASAVHNLEEVLVKDLDDIQKVMRFAMSKRKTAATELNERSSRSHAIFTLTLHMKDVTDDGEEVMRIGKINLVDLAGSESVGRSGSKDARAREAGSINQSLLTLGRVISALVEKLPHVPYRDSKLTRLLQESLGGCALTCIVATVAPSVQCLDETLSTLEYASRAKSIKNKPSQNQKVTKKMLLKEYVEEMERIRQELAAARAREGVFLPESAYNELLMQVKGTSTRVTDLESEAERRNAEMSELRLSLTNQAAELKRTHADLDHTKARLNETKEGWRLTKQELEESKAKTEEQAATIQAHVLNEARLLDIQASLQKSLQAAADAAVRLHASLDRKRGLEAENLSTVREHRSHMEESLTLLHSTTREAADEHAAVLSRLERVLDACAKTVEAEGPQAREARSNELSAEIARRMQVAFDDAMQTARAAKESTIEDSTVAFKALSETSDAMAEMLDLAQASVREMERSKREHVAALKTKVIAPLVGELERSRGSTRAFAASQFAAISMVRDAVEATQMQLEIIERDARARRAAAHKTSMKDLQRETSALAAKFKEELEKLCSKTNERSLERLDHENDLGDENMDMLTKETESVRHALDYLNSSGSTWAALEEHVSSETQSLARTEEEASFGGVVAKAQHQSRGLAHELEQRTDRAVRVAREGYSHADACVRRAHVDANERVDALRASNEETMRSFISLEAQAKKEAAVFDRRAKETLSEATKLAQAMGEIVTKASAAQTSQTETAVADVRRFTIREDKPSGATPGRVNSGIHWSHLDQGASGPTSNVRPLGERDSNNVPLRVSGAKVRALPSFASEGKPATSLPMTSTAATKRLSL